MSAPTLDDPALLALDAGGMLGHIQNVGAELERAWSESDGLVLPPGAERATGVVLAGMGGSATAADYFAAICAASAAVPVAVVRGYGLPNWVGEETLVVACSYSGNTEETLAAYDDAWKRDAMLLAITRPGGALAKRAAADGVPVHVIDYDAQPRATTVHTLAPLLRLGARLGLCAANDSAIRAAAAGHRSFVERDLAPNVPLARNGAKQLAAALAGRFAIVLGAEHLMPAAVRMRNQLSENGKALGAAEALPEAAHNLVVGLATAPALAGSMALATLESPLYDPRVGRKFDAVAALFAAEGVPVHRFEVGGRTVLEQLLQATAWGDFVSFYLALAHGHDPTPVPQIERVRAWAREE